MGTPRIPIAERFYGKWHIDPITDCWEWTGYKNPSGYGLISAGGKPRAWLRAHRVSWSLRYGDPGALHVCHRCDNPPCVNPDHLFLGTDADNMRDCAQKGRTDRSRKVKGEAHPGAKLNDAAILEIRGSRKSLNALAEEFGVSKKLVLLVKQRKAWKHVGE